LYLFKDIKNLLMYLTYVTSKSFNNISGRYTTVQIFAQT